MGFLKLIHGNRAACCWFMQVDDNNKTKTWSQKRLKFPIKLRRTAAVGDSSLSLLTLHTILIFLLIAKSSSNKMNTDQLIKNVRQY